ncbi:AAA family ATPase [archaeon]|nr:AAA family ATPase [archaeon]
MKEDNLGVSLNLVNIISSEMDGFNVNKYQTKNLILAATNDIDAVSKKLLRPGKFDEIIEFIVPNREELGEIFNIHLEQARKISGINYSVNIPNLTEKLHKKTLELQNQGYLGLVGADIENILRLALKKIHLQVLDNGMKVGSDSLKEEEIIDIIEKYDLSKRQDRK